jgi:hypothetical protein
MSPNSAPRHFVKQRGSRCMSYSTMSRPPLARRALRLAPIPEELNATRFFVDLDFVAGMHGDERLVVGGINRVWGGIGQARIAKTDQDTGVVVAGTERMG